MTPRTPRFTGLKLQTHSPLPLHTRLNSLEGIRHVRDRWIYRSTGSRSGPHSGLKRLEYRGYDSAGVAIINGDELSIRKFQGKIAKLEEGLAGQGITGSVGIAHTRWATHGVPSDRNAHPHPDCSGRLAVVHNGIIENHRELRTRLVSSGHHLASETDTEVLAHLIEQRINGSLEGAVSSALKEIHGACAVAVVDQEFPDRIVAARVGGSPMIVGSAMGNTSSPRISRPFCLSLKRSWCSRTARLPS